MKKNKSEKEQHNNGTDKTTDEDSIEVSSANADNRYSAAEAKKGITGEGGNASADVRKPREKKDIGNEQESPQSQSTTGNLGKTTQSPLGPSEKDGNN